MKPHSADFKTNITNMGREIKSIITYGNETLEEELYAVTPHYTGNILKSVMKQLDIESTVDIPENTIVNYKLGLKVNDNYEYLDFGNYVVYKSEKSEDKKTYLITCYDKMVYAMKQNEDLGIVYPISIKNYLVALATKIGLTVANNTFYNQNETIPAELYVDLPYTYRDILDEIAQATGSIICINANDEIEVRYPTDTHDTIDESFFKDTDVTFKEKYGPINTIVLSRTAEADNVYYPDPLPQNPVELKIIDNQILNFNNRSNFMPGMLSGVENLEYYTNDYSSKGILYYEVGDIYHVRIGEKTYQCIMLNDEINITQGIEEIVNTEMPEQSKTDYTKADKTDQRINEAYLILDKQKRELNGVLSTVGDHTTQINTIDGRVGSLESSISEISDITTSQNTMTGRLIFENINQSEPIRIEIKPIEDNITYLYPFDNLFPADNLYLTGRTLRLTNTTTSEVFEWELPDDLLYYDSEHYDEFVLDYESDACFVTKRCEYNSVGQVVIKATERVDEYPFPHEEMQLTDGDYTVEILKYETTPYQAYLFARMMVQNYYTTQFATRAEMNSKISQTSSNVLTTVNAKFTNYSTTTEMNGAINVKANEITTQVSENYATKATTNSLSTRIKSTAKSIELAATDNTTSANLIIRLRNEDGTQIDSKTANITMSGLVKFTDLKGNGTTEINGANIKTGTLSANKISGGSLNLTGTNTTITSTKFSVDKNGNITATGGTIGGFTIGSHSITAQNGNNTVFLNDASNGNQDFLVVRTGTSGNYKYPFYVRADGTMSATNANISGTITAISGTFDNCTIKNTCIVPAGTISGTLATSNIPNLSASKITSGTMSGDRISGGTISGSSISAITVFADSIGLNNQYEAYYAGNLKGQTASIIVQHEGQYWRKLVFTGGILTAVLSSW